jgi:hypothetical protein
MVVVIDFRMLQHWYCFVRNEVGERIISASFLWVLGRILAVVVAVLVPLAFTACSHLVQYHIARKGFAYWKSLSKHCFHIL